MKKIKYLLLLIITFLISSDSVLANIDDYVVDFNRVGDINVTLKETNNNESINGAELTIYKVANVVNENNNLKYVYIDDIKNCDGDLTNLLDSSLSGKIDKCIGDKNISTKTGKTNENGILKFDNLELGLYLVKQTNSVEGYSKIDSFLVNIPEVIDNKWVYSINATPKTDIIKLMDVIVIKKWDNISDETPKEVIIQLLKDDEVIDEIILNNENNWTYTWEQIEASDSYSVKEINVPVGYTATYRHVDNQFIVTNTKTLVQTGQNLVLIEILLILGVMFVISGVILNKRINNE